MSSSKENSKVVLVVGASGLMEICKDKSAAIGFIKKESGGHRAELLREHDLEGRKLWEYTCGEREWNLEEKLVLV